MRPCGLVRMASIARFEFGLIAVVLVIPTPGGRAEEVRLSLSGTQLHIGATLTPLLPECPR